MEIIQYRMWNESTNSKYFYDIDQVMECLKQQMLFDANNNNPLGYNHIGDGNSFEQFTGFKDKNGEYIYEGHLIELISEFHGSSDEYGFGQESYHHKYVGVVKFMPSRGFYLKVIKKYDMYSDDVMKPEPRYKEIVQYRSEIIGNIHDNK